jgi:hypothetical protein
MNDLIAMYEEQGLTLVLDEERNIARCDRPAPRSRLGFKSEFHTRYQSVERMILVCTQFIENRIANQKAKEEYKIAQKIKKVSEGYDCENVRLVPNSFKGEEMTKRLNNYGGFKTYSHSSASKTTADATHYRSWYY